ncbi:MAG: hypothetical protein K6T29_03515 [Peptococcaceae bacterium]|nr:hypothetical protein [Peptococcaceae bacterium]
MMDYDDFEEINRLLEKSCDHCLLTRRHCPGCRIEKLRKIVAQFSRPDQGEIILIELSELKVLLKLAGESGHGGAGEQEIIAKWSRIAAEASGQAVVTEENPA